jgi:CheY-like chemotaxis protein
MSKLVIIDADPVDQLLMKNLFESNSYFDSTTYTLYGSLVLDYIEENKSLPDKLPDVILLDLNISDFNGWDFLERFQQLYNEVKKNIKVYVLTSSAMPADREHTAQYSFVKSLIDKPLQKSALLEINQEALC